jgi:hypothetical protein
MPIAESLIIKKTRKENTELKKEKKQCKKSPYPSMDEQVKEFAEIIVTHLLNNPQLWK